MAIRESITIDEAIEVLNSGLKADPVAMTALIGSRVKCNPAFAGHPTIQVGDHPECGGMSVGLLGILNGLFGIDEQGWGPIVAHFDVGCPAGCLDGTEHKFDVNEHCPECGKRLVLGSIIKFTKAKAKEACKRLHDLIPKKALVSARNV